MASPPIKISLKNTTKMTLNSRNTKHNVPSCEYASNVFLAILWLFGGTCLKTYSAIQPSTSFTSIMKSRPSSTQSVRNQASTIKSASEKNRRLTQQMERRPTVEAALGINQQYRPPPQPKPFKSPVKTSVMDRLGTARGRGRGVATRARFLVNRRGITRQNHQQQNSDVTSFKSNRGRGRGAGFRGTRGQNAGRGQFRGAQRGAARGRGNTRGRGANKGAAGKPVDKDKLDTDLDKYMAKTKSSMDAELDQYMANVGK